MTTLFYIVIWLGHNVINLASCWAADDNMHQPDTTVSSCMHQHQLDTKCRCHASSIKLSSWLCIKLIPWHRSLEWEKCLTNMIILISLSSSFISTSGHAYVWWLPARDTGSWFSRLTIVKDMKSKVTYYEELRTHKVARKHRRKYQSRHSIKIRAVHINMEGKSCTLIIMLPYPIEIKAETSSIFVITRRLATAGFAASTISKYIFKLSNYTKKLQLIAVHTFGSSHSEYKSTK